MSWKQTAIAILADMLRFLGRAALLVDAILLSVFSVWLVWKLVFHSADWLNRTIFSSPW